MRPLSPAWFPASAAFLNLDDAAMARYFAWESDRNAWPHTIEDTLCDFIGEVLRNYEVAPLNSSREKRSLNKACPAASVTSMCQSQPFHEFLP